MVGKGGVEKWARNTALGCTYVGCDGGAGVLDTVGQGVHYPVQRKTLKPWPQV